MYIPQLVYPFTCYYGLDLTLNMLPKVFCAGRLVPSVVMLRNGVPFRGGSWLGGEDYICKKGLMLFSRQCLLILVRSRRRVGCYKLRPPHAFGPFCVLLIRFMFFYHDVTQSGVVHLDVGTILFEPSSY
jgi:hypothetical protein